MVEVKQLYQALIVEHSQSPENFRVLAGHTHCTEISNPVCGDEISLYARIEDGLIHEVTFHGSACAICMASASIMTREVTGLTLAAAEKLAIRFFAVIEGNNSNEGSDGEAVGHPDLLAFRGVARFPVRIQCAKLPWEALAELSVGGSVV